MSKDPGRARLVILDRDGVINEDSDDYIKSPEEWIPVPGSLEAIGRLTRAEFRVFVLTNQSGIARQYFDEAVLASIHQRMCDAIQAHGGKVEAILYCPHGPNDACDCRKPLPGLFRSLSEKIGIDLSGYPAVGDSYRDLVAAKEVGASPILVRTGKGLRTLASHPAPGCPVCDDLSAAVDLILENW
jgi:D-glycero-D-manno-heptose 1,7-bisphosphate phosphatase